MKKFKILLYLALTISLTYASNFHLSFNNFANNIILEAKPYMYLDLGLNNDKVAFQSLQSVKDIDSAGFYIRRKFDNQTYSIYRAQPSHDAAKDLYAFNPKDIGLTSKDVAFIKVYSSKGKKPFRDERDLYLDNEFIYSSRVQILHFVLNGNWVSLKNFGRMGAVEFVSSLKNVSIWQNNINIGNTPYMSLNLPGTDFVVAKKEGYFPKVVVQKAIREINIKKNIDLIKMEKIFFNLTSPISIENISLIKKRSQLDSLKNLVNQDLKILQEYKIKLIEYFESIYEPANTAYLGFPKYLEIYSITKQEALNLFLQNILKTEENLGKSLALIDLKYEDLRNQIYSVYLHPKDLKYRKLSQDSLNSNYLVKLKFGDLKAPNEFIWEGNFQVDSLTLYNLVASIKDTVASNKPNYRIDFLGHRAYLPLTNGNVVEKYYRYQNIYLVDDKNEFKYDGKFILPPYVESLQEVKAWRKIFDDTSKNIPAIDSSVIAETLKEEIITIDSNKYIEELRGPIVNIPAGKFVYKGKPVEMSTFSINTTEITQEHYKRLKDSIKTPIKGDSLAITHVTWYEANMFCIEIGGSLPTEAQWEYAARAGVHHGHVNTPDSNYKVSDYAYLSTKNKLRDKLQNVAQLKPNKWGIYDMAGNVSEWILDKKYLKPVVSASDPKGPKKGHYRVIKGGSWKDQEKDQDFTDRDWDDPRYWGSTIGFRCVYPQTYPFTNKEAKEKLIPKIQYKKSKTD